MRFFLFDYHDQPNLKSDHTCTSDDLSKICMAPIKMQRLHMIKILDCAAGPGHGMAGWPVDGWMDGWMGGRMDEWINAGICAFKF